MNENLVLGLDIGVRSVGWALVRENGDNPTIVAAGSRVFPLGVDEQSFESRNIERRLARQRRRLLARRRMRLDAVRALLQRNHLLPRGRPDYQDAAWRETLHSNPYALRAAALRRKLDPYDLGRAIYHLAHRRGFKSNRKGGDKDDEKSQVKSAIRDLKSSMSDAGAETLGEYLARLDPREQRIRERYTARDWYREEFDLIIKRQLEFGHPLPDTLIEALKHAIFFQRKIWWDPSTIGRCPFEKRRTRAHASLPACQRFRLLQSVNHLMIIMPNGSSRALTIEERTTALSLLEQQESVSFGKLRKALRLPNTTRFNLEEGGNEKLIGNVTAARIREAIGAKWDAAPEPIKAAIYEAVASIEDEDLLKRLAMKKNWGLTEEEAEKLSEVTLEADRLALSSRAIRRILPYLEEGLSYAEASQKAYPNVEMEPRVDRLPPLEDLRNPTAQRALTETRRVVNAIIKRYGLPGRIRIELARDMKKPKKVRVEKWKFMRKRAAEREKARERIIKEAGISNPSSADIEKVLLFEECGGICPYTGAGIRFADLFGPDAGIEVEHIIPWSRSLDNSFANKTLCVRSANREKNNRTPFEAFGGHAERYSAILSRVRAFRGPYAEEKLRRFQCENPEGPESALLIWSGADLRVTSQAARRAASYLARLYPPEERKSRIQVSAGRTTAMLRAAWDLNRLLGIAYQKNRADHRHHAVDAIVVALTTPALIRELTLAASRARRPGGFTGMPTPPRLHEQVRELLDKMIVSHRVDRRVQGRLHEESHYGIIRCGGEERAVIRKRLQDLKATDVEDIVDPAIRELVREALGGGDPQKVFADPERRPQLPSAKGRPTRIRRVRIFAQSSADNLIRLNPCRNVAGGSNSHLEVFSIRDKRGNPSWRCDVISRFEAMCRKKRGEPIVRRADSAGNPLVFSLSIGDTVRFTYKGRERVCVVQKLSFRNYVFREATDGRIAKEIQDKIDFRSDHNFYKSGCTKLSVDPLGETRIAHD